ncbi:MAG: bis(5'-nucleosyl)-tetraphosphatase (symmetrical) YqeK [Candidatus Enterenecus sp.]
MKIGIYGGSFNPPHLGHMAAARAAMAALGLDRLLIVPACDPPHKALPAGSATPEQRLEMTAIMADLLPGAECWDVEIAREGISYTVDTLEEAKRLWPEAELWLLMGTDMFLTLQEWRNPERILELAGVCAFGREQGDEERLFAPQREYLSRSFGGKIATLSIPDLVEVSSTLIRERLARGDWTCLAPSVYGYILRKGLYGTSADLTRLTVEELRCVSYSMVKAKRLAHIRGTEETAVELARRWGADPEKLRRAAILHDCTKYLPLEEHLAICDRYGIALDEMERGAEKLLHAKSGAALAKYVFGQDDEIFTAILYHTTARGNMTLAEKILYLADYMEPNRDFPEVEELRRLAWEDLDRAVLMGIRLSIREMLERNRVVHHNTLEAEASLLKGISQ